ncbi:hypothetical protein [Treponema sp.]|uniref:hypothetical protein n=1 Tax=Treponema sp. TaxID=166 RepID=UPI00388DFBBD
MKKLLLALAFAAAMVFSASAEESKESTPRVWDHGDNISSITYQNVRFYKIYDAADAYVILYEKQGVKIGTAVLPKKWVKNTEGHRKLLFRNAPAKIGSYLTIIKKDGEFQKVLVTVPSNRWNPIWAMAPRNMEINGTDADSLEIEL